MGSPFFIIEELYWELCEKGGKRIVHECLTDIPRSAVHAIDRL